MNDSSVVPAPPVEQLAARGDIAVRQQQLDFLRGVAATYVVCNHARGSFFAGGQKILADGASLFEYISVAALQLTSLGAEFVILFFVLSGFAMRHSVRHSSGTGRFYLKRIIRIWPPYIAAVLFALAIDSAFGGDAVRQKLLPLLFYQSTSTPLTPQFWSLPYEVLFYALCPLILANPARVRAVGAVAILASLVTLAWKGPLLNPFASLPANFLGNELLFFAAGALCYEYLDRVPRLSGRMLLASVIALFLTAYAIKVVLGGSNMGSNLVMIALTILAIRNVPDWLAGIRWANFGEFSYSIYIYHFAILYAILMLCRANGLEPTEIRNPFVWMGIAPLMVGGSYLLYLVTEKKSNAIVASLRKGRRPAPVAASASPPAA